MNVPQTCHVVLDVLEDVEAYHRIYFAAPRFEISSPAQVANSGFDIRPVMQVGSESAQVLSVDVGRNIATFP